jgi:serine/threonine protein kinase
MSHPELLNDPPAQVAGPVTAAPQQAHKLVEEMRALHARGEPADVRAVLDRHPGLVPDRALLIDLACEEFSQRRADGEVLDYVAFADGFPEFGASLREILVTRAYFDANPDLLNGAALSWPQPGACLFGFALLEELGRGSYSRVFLAQQPEVADRLVVLKVSFLDGLPEAEALAHLSHQNIIPILSLHGGDEGGWTAVCMPYHGTATLSDVLDYLKRQNRPPRRARVLLEAIRATPLPQEPTRTGIKPHPLLQGGSYFDGALHLAAQLAEAVAYVHSQDICHRDLKPANVLLTPDGRPLLLDFNLSCSGDSVDQGPGGTLPYMAPEQIGTLCREGETARAPGDPRSDVYSLGVMLYELLSGRHPFGPLPSRLTPRELARWLLERQRSRPLPLRAVNAEVGQGLGRQLDRCLSPDPDERPTAAVLAEALRRAFTFPHRAARAVRLHRRALVGVAALILGAVLFGLLRPSRTLPAHALHFQAGEVAARQGRHAEAVEHFTSTLKSEGPSARVLFARGLALYRMQEMERALADWRKADGLSKDGKVKAALAACCVWPDSMPARADGVPPQTDHHTAIWYYSEAIKAGYGTARVYNNRGFSHARRGEIREARADFTEAIRRDPNLQAAYYNRAVLCLKGHGGGERMTLAEGRGDRKRSLELLRAALADIEKAVNLGPASASLHRDAGRLYALTALLDGDRDLPRRGVLHLTRAVDLGCPLRDLRSDANVLAGLRREPALTDLLNRNDLGTQARMVVRCPDPLPDRP